MRPKGANGRFGGVERGRAVIGDELNYSTTLRISQARPKGENGRFGGVGRGRAVIGDELNYFTIILELAKPTQARPRVQRPF